MTKTEFKQAFELAKSDGDTDSNISHLFGCGLKDFVPVACTISQVAYLLRYQALQFNGEWVMEEVDNLFYIAVTAKRFIIIG